MTSDKLFLTIAALLIAAGLGYAYLTSPTTVTLALGGGDSQDSQLFHAFGQQLKTQRSALRLLIRTVPSTEDASKLLDSGNADLAVVRPDIRNPVNGLTVALLREAAVIIVIPHGAEPEGEPAAEGGAPDGKASQGSKAGGAAPRVIAQEDATPGEAKAPKAAATEEPAAKGAAAKTPAKVASADGVARDFASLAGKTIGVGLGHPADPDIVKAILHHLELDGASGGVIVAPMPREDILFALKENRIQAAAIVAPPTGRVASNFVRGIAGGFEGKIDVIGVESPEMLAHGSPSLSAATIPAGIWGVRPKRPAEDVKTVAAGYRLMAHKDLDRSTVALLTESLFQMRTRLAMSASSANQMRAPEMDTASTATTAVLPNHPGAVDYFQRETQSLMDRYGDFIYLGFFFGSALISAAAAFQQRFQRRGREKVDDVLDRLIAILADARGAESSSRLDDLSAEIDGLLSRAVDHARDHGSGARATAALVLALDGARTGIVERRRTLLGQHEPGRRDGAPRLVTVS